MMDFSGTGDVGRGNDYFCNSGYCNGPCIIMKFYDREIETETLRRIEETSHEYAQMTVITGRRHI